MIHDHTAFDAARDPGFLDLGPYEIAIGAEVERITIRRGRRTPPAPTHLTGDQIGKLAIIGAITGTIIAFLIDPHGAWAALCSIVAL